MEINNLASNNGFQITDLTSKNDRNEERTLDLILIQSEKYSLKVSVKCTEEFKKSGWELLETDNIELIDKIKDSLKDNISLVFSSKDNDENEIIF
jgi:hypothetical protein